MIEFLVNTFVALIILRFVAVGNVSYGRRVYGALLADILTLFGAAFWAFETLDRPEAQGFVIVALIFGLIGAIVAALNSDDSTPVEKMTDQFKRLSQEVIQLRVAIGAARNDETMTRAERLSRIDYHARLAEERVDAIGAKIAHAMTEASK